MCTKLNRHVKMKDAERGMSNYIVEIVIIYFLSV